MEPVPAVINESSATVESVTVGVSVTTILVLLLPINELLNVIDGFWHDVKKDMIHTGNKKTNRYCIFRNL